jgi:hypothetical protein
MSFPWARGHLKILRATCGPRKNSFYEPDWHSQSLFQLHLAKKGFGQPDQTIKLKSLEKFRTFMRNPIDLPEPLIMKAFEYSLNWARTKIGKNTFSSLSTSFGASSCLENTRENGGKSYLLTTEFQSFLSQDPHWKIIGKPKNQYFDIWGREVFNEKALPPVEEDDWEDGPLFLGSNPEDVVNVVWPAGNTVFSTNSGRAKELLFQMYLFGAAYENGDYLFRRCFSGIPMILTEEGRTSKSGNPFWMVYPEDPCLDPDFDIFHSEPSYRVDTVEDDGAKARVITVGSAYSGSLGHIFRTYLYDLLSSDEECILGDRDKSSAGHLKSLFKTPLDLDFVWLSLDLSSATDTFHSGVCNALARGAAEAAFQANKGYWRILKFLSYRVAMSSVLMFPDGTEELQLRGMLMGTPESWGILNLYEGFWLRLAETLFETFDSPPLLDSELDLTLITTDTPHVKRIYPSIRCGDDQSTYGPEKLMKMFLRLLIRSGCLPSPGTNTISKSVVIFTESLASWQNTAWNWIDILRVVGLVNFKGMNRFPTAKEVPRIWFRGEAYSRGLEWWTGKGWRDEVRLSMLLFAQYSMVDFLRHIAEIGIEVFLPIELGGYGLPHPRGSEMSHVKPAVRRIVQYVLSDNESIDVFFDRRSLNIWTVGGSSRLAKAMEEAEVMLRRYITFQIPQTTDPDPLKADTCRFSLGAVRTYLKISIKLEDIGFRIVSEAKKELKMISLSEFVDNILDRIRGRLSYHLESPSISDQEYHLSSRAAKFRKNLKALRAKSLSFDPHVSKSWDLVYVKKRLNWLKEFQFVRLPDTKSTYIVDTVSTRVLAKFC